MIDLNGLPIDSPRDRVDALFGRARIEEKATDDLHPFTIGYDFSGSSGDMRTPHGAHCVNLRCNRVFFGAPDFVPRKRRTVVGMRADVKAMHLCGPLPESHPMHKEPYDPCFFSIQIFLPCWPFKKERRLLFVVSWLADE